METKIESESIRISFVQIQSELFRILTKNGLKESHAKTCADIFAGNSLDGVYSHGVNRFPKFIQYLKKGYIKPSQEAVCKNALGNIEQWDGQSGLGPVNALACTSRVMEISKQNGMGMISLANTNHWLRGGTYGWHAAKAGFVFIGWSNTIANLPA